MMHMNSEESRVLTHVQQVFLFDARIELVHFRKLLSKLDDLVVAFVQLLNTTGIFELLKGKW